MSGFYIYHTPGEAAKCSKEVYQEAITYLLENFPDIIQKAPEILEEENRCMLDTSGIVNAREEQASCAHCPGYENCRNVPKGHYHKVVFEHGKIFVVPTSEPCQAKKHAIWAKKLEAALQRSQLPQLLASKGFRNFDKNVHPHAAKMAASAEEASRSGRSLVLAGNYGCGKSHLAAAILNNAIRKQKTGFYISVPEMIDDLRSAARSNGGDDEKPLKVLDGIVDVDVLVLDDLGKERPTVFAMEKLFEIIDRRLRGQKQLIITTNYTDPEALTCKMGDYGEAIRSRFKEICGAGGWVISQAHDYRDKFCKSGVRQVNCRISFAESN